MCRVSMIFHLRNFLFFITEIYDEKQPMKLLYGRKVSETKTNTQTYAIKQKRVV